MTSTKATLRRLVTEKRGILVPGAFNAMSATAIVDAGFEVVYITGAGVTNMNLGLPDLSFMGLHEIAENTQRIREVVDVPLIVDIDTGFGNPVNTYHTVRRMEAAGADALQIEDQVFPKKCGHFNGKGVVETDDIVQKIKAAVDARRDENLLIIGRTDAAAVHGFEAAVERAQKFAEAGADILFVEAVEKHEDIARIPKMLDKPLLINIVIGGKTPAKTAEQFGEMGFALVLYANAALQGAVAGMTRALKMLKKDGILAEDPNIVAPFNERQRLVHKPFYDELEQKYK
jgi:2-methylisocitrate lyase-like PEP mutase family enzyme